jgi:arginyl-tRNA synthetase
VSADALKRALVAAAQQVGAPAGTDPVLERPRDPSFGDWTTNLAMTLAKPLGRKPRDVAQALIDALDLGAAGVAKVEIAGPGFLNFRLDPGAQAAGIARIVDAPDAWGRSATGAGRRANVEFVSANPTGPLHVGHGRQAALGDAIATLLEWTGWHVSREFYYNDAGTQIENLAKSVWIRIAQQLGIEVAIPEGGYNGEYIKEIAAKVIADKGEELILAHVKAGAEAIAAGRRPSDQPLFDRLRLEAVAALRKEQDLDMQAFGVKFDTYFLESSLYTDGKVEDTVTQLVAGGHTFEEDGALFLRTTAFGDDKDRVMKKSAAKGGDFTYFVPDVAYHVNKWERGFGRAINVQGADHHSTVTRVRAGLQALHMGIPQGYPEYVLHQMVTVMKGGEEVKISKRAGSYVTVRDLIDWVGRDAVRYFFLMRKGDSQLVFDVDLARSQSEENPVYYIQMAHARMSGILRNWGGDPATIHGAGTDLAPLAAEEEQRLIKALLDFPAMVEGAAQALEPHRVATWLLDTARLAHTWYHKHHVLGEPEPILRARLVLARATQRSVAAGLALLGISAPERM